MSRGRRRSEPLAGRRVAIMMLGIDRTLASLPSVAEAIQAADEALSAGGASVERLRSKRAADAAFPLRPIMDVTAVQPLVDRFLDDPGKRTAIFCPADTVAAMVYRALATRGVQPGTDVAVVSCNNERGVVAGLWPALATVDVQLRRIGGLAVNQLTRRIRGEFDGTGVTVEVAPSLVPEASLAPPAGASKPR